MPRPNPAPRHAEPRCQWSKISVTPTTSKLLLAIHSSRPLIDGNKRSICEDPTSGDTLVVPVGNYVIAAPRNYVIANRLNLGISVIADTPVLYPRGSVPFPTHV